MRVLPKRHGQCGRGPYAPLLGGAGTAARPHLTGSPRPRAESTCWQQRPAPVAADTRFSPFGDVRPGETGLSVDFGVWVQVCALLAQTVRLCGALRLSLFTWHTDNETDSQGGWEAQQVTGGCPQPRNGLCMSRTHSVSLHRLEWRRPMGGCHDIALCHYSYRLVTRYLFPVLRARPRARVLVQKEQYRRLPFLADLSSVPKVLFEFDLFSFNPHNNLKVNITITPIGQGNSNRKALNTTTMRHTVQSIRAP